MKLTFEKDSFTVDRSAQFYELPRKSIFVWQRQTNLDGKYDCYSSWIKTEQVAFVSYSSQSSLSEPSEYEFIRDDRNDEIVLGLSIFRGDVQVIVQPIIADIYWV